MKNQINHLAEGSLIIELDSSHDACLKDASVVKGHTTESLTWETTFGGEPTDDSAVIFDEEENEILSFGFLDENMIQLNLEPDVTVLYCNVGNESIHIEQECLVPGQQMVCHPVSL